MENLALNNYIISSLFLLLIIGGIIGIITFIFLLRYKYLLEVKFWLIWQIAAIVWTFTYALEYGATDIETKIFWSKFSYFGIVFEAISFLFFVLAFSSNFRFLTRKYIVPAYILSACFIIFPFTNDLHHLHWRSYSINPDTNATSYVYGPFFWALIVVTYFELFTGIVIIYRLFYRLSGYYKRQNALLFIAALLPLLGNVIYVFHINPIPGFDWTPLTFLLTGILIAINISQFRMFDLVPFARNKLIDIIPDAILIVDKSLRIADYNSAFLSLLDSAQNKEIIGLSVSDIFHHRLPLIQEAVKHDDFHTEVSREVNGMMQFYDMQVNSLYDYRKQQTGRLVILKDITARVLSEEKIKESNALLINEIHEREKLIQDLDAFSHTVAHDLKGMLSAMITASNLIQVSFDDMSKEDLLEVVDLIGQTATKTTHITSELLTLASVRQQEITPVPVDMQMVVQEAITRLKDMIQDFRAEIIYPEVWINVMGYKAWLEEVMLNYLSNAIKYGGTPPEVRIDHEILADGRVKFFVYDNGNGISEEDTALLFKKFTRLDSLRVEGHGLGLSIVKRIIEKLNGEVGVESKNKPGEGSSFYFILPKA